MCGIAGIVTSQNFELSDLSERLSTMAGAMRHRGPDDEGIYLSPDRRVGLANRRLAIRDLSPAGHMPMSNAEGTVWITYNGEIYNTDELRPQLERDGYHFRSSSDTEIILRGYEVWGTDVLARLEGMFAFAIYDCRERPQLLLARDPMGIKPLYYAFSQDTLVFASELNTILASQLVSRAIDPVGLAGYLRMGSVPNPLTIYQGIAALEPASAFIFYPDRWTAPQPAAYWSLPTDLTSQSNAAQAAQIAALVRENPNLHRRFTVHMRTTGSHAKLIMADTPEDGWIAAIGSCNWLSSPFNAVELTAVLRNQHVVADVAVAIQNLVGRRGFADAVANEMGITARDLRRAAPASGDANVTVVVGDAHDRLIRAASGAAKTLFVVGSNMLGSTARPGAIMQGETAARQGLRPMVVYTKPTGPLKNRHTRALAEEAAQNGVSLIRTKKIPLHAKFVAWDADDLVVTSLNWASASADHDFPWGDIGVHIHAPNLAADVIARLRKILPEIDPDNGAEQPA